MAATFPCPNPMCTHAFVADQLKGAARLTCPRCGTVFQFGPQAPSSPAPPRSSPPVTAPVARSAPPRRPAAPRPAPAQPAKASPPRQAPPPLPASKAAGAAPAAPIPMAHPVAAPVAPAGASSALAFEEQGGSLVQAPTGVRRRLSPEQSRKRLYWQVPLGLFVVAGVSVLVLYVLVPWVKRTVATSDPEVRKSLEQANYRFAHPGGGWGANPEDRDRADEVRVRMVVNFALTTSAPPNRLAIYWQDFKTRLPSEGELIDIALRKLRGTPPEPGKAGSGDAYFEALEWEKHESDPPFQLGRRPALKIEFQGVDPDRVLCNGECYMMAHRGYGYWLFTWGPLQYKEQLAAEWDSLRQGFELGDGRDGWQETPGESELVSVPSLPYQVRFEKAIWERKLSDSFDPKAQLVLMGHDPTRTRHVGRAATLQVLLLPAAAALPQAREEVLKYILEREKLEYPETVLAPVKTRDGKDVDYPTELGGVRGHLVKLRVTNTEAGRERYMVVFVVNAPEGTIAFWLDCDWTRRDYWEYEFQPLLNSIRALGKAAS